MLPPTDYDFDLLDSQGCVLPVYEIHTVKHSTAEIHDVLCGEKP